MSRVLCRPGASLLDGSAETTTHFERSWGTSGGLGEFRGSVGSIPRGVVGRHKTYGKEQGPGGLSERMVRCVLYRHKTEDCKRNRR